MDRLGDVGIISEKYSDFKNEIKRLYENDYDKYIQERTRFYINPLHWNNNKRKIHGLHTLRGDVNKFRLKEFPSFRISDTFFGLIEDVIDEIIKEEFPKFQKNFVEINDIALSDKDFIWSYKQGGNLKHGQIII